MFDGLYRWFSIPVGNDSDDLYDGSGLFVIHANDVFAVKELAFIYLVVFVLMYIAGPGKFSIDYFIGSKLAHNKRK